MADATLDRTIRNACRPAADELEQSFAPVDTQSFSVTSVGHCFELPRIRDLSDEFPRDHLSDKTYRVAPVGRDLCSR